MDPFILGVAVASAILLVILAAFILGALQRREMRTALGLPSTAPLKPQDKRAFLAFENTDMQLRDSFPDASKRRRQMVTQKLLRERGVLARGPRNAP